MARFIQTKQQSEENSFSGTPEQMLWVAVLSRAAEDITKTSDWVAAREAINWVKRKNKDFKLVCEMAGRNPDYVQAKVRKVLLRKEGWNVDVPITSHYRQGPKRGSKRGKYKRKHLTGNSYYAAMGKKGGRPRLYVV